MSHYFVSCTFHCVVGTKMRQLFLTDEVREKLLPYIIGIAHHNSFRVLAIGGISNHLHILLSLPSELSLAKAMQFIKGGSSRWIHTTFSDLLHFSWQQGYSAFSIGISQRRKTIEYIQNQAQHHQQRTFEQELQIFFIRHGFKWDASVLE